MHFTVPSIVQIHPRTKEDGQEAEQEEHEHEQEKQDEQKKQLFVVVQATLHIMGLT